MADDPNTQTPPPADKPDETIVLPGVMDGTFSVIGWFE